MDYLFPIGRVLFAAFFLNSAYGHFKNVEMMAGYSASKGIPAPKLAVLGTGTLLLLGGLGIILGIAVQWALLCLVVFLVPVSFMMHAYWKVTDPAARMSERMNFLRNVALLGAVLMMYFLPTPWPMSIGH
ncbi:MAG: DoxX family membrane protein [Gemmatimonadales bacterium]